jgi:hypothetical protein
LIAIQLDILHIGWDIMIVAVDEDVAPGTVVENFSLGVEEVLAGIEFTA